MTELIPALGILAGIIIPISAFAWLYHENKGKREIALEIAKHIDDPAKVEEFLRLFEDRKAQPIDYRRGGLITAFVGVGLFLFGSFFLGPIVKASGALVGTIGIGVLIAGYVYPNTSEELTEAVDDFERR